MGLARDGDCATGRYYDDRGAVVETLPPGRLEMELGAVIGQLLVEQAETARRAVCTRAMHYGSWEISDIWTDGV